MAPERIIEETAATYGMKRSALQKAVVGGRERAVAAYWLCRHAGLTQRAAGKLLGFGTGAAVSWQLKQLRKDLREDRKLHKEVARIERQIREKGA